MKVTRIYSKSKDRYYLCLKFDDNSVWYNNEVVSFFIDKYASIYNVHPVSVRNDILCGKCEININLVG